jgi:putative MATE family efflux protein
MTNEKNQAGVEVANATSDFAEEKGNSMSSTPEKATAQSTARLGVDRIGKLLFEFSVPAIVAMVFSILYNVIDTAILGRFVGDDGVAVTTLVLPVMTILTGFSMLAGQGGSALAAIQLGEGKVDRVEKTLGNTAVLLIIMPAIIIVCAFVFIDPILLIIGTNEELWEPTKAFVQIICSLFIFQSLGLGLNNFLRTAGKPTLALITQVFGTLMCVVFNVLFVAVMGFGVPGSAFATVLGQLFCMIPVVWYFIFCKKSPFHLRLANCRLQGRLVAQIMSLGLASFAMQVASTVVGIVLNQMLAIYGPTDSIGETGALSAIGVAQKSTMIVFAFLIGLTAGMQPIVGYNYGARKWDRVIKTLKLACIWGVIFGTIYLVLSHIAPRQIVDIFGVSGDLEEFSVMTLQIYTIFFPLVGFQVVGGSYFQSSGQPVKAAVIELLRQVILLIPMYLIFPHFAGFFGVSPLMMIVIAVPASDILSVLVTSVLVAVEAKKLVALRRGTYQGELKEV